MYSLTFELLRSTIIKLLDIDIDKDNEVHRLYEFLGKQLIIRKNIESELIAYFLMPEANPHKFFIQRHLFGDEFIYELPKNSKKIETYCLSYIIPKLVVRSYIGIITQVQDKIDFTEAMRNYTNVHELVLTRYRALADLSIIMSVRTEQNTPICIVEIDEDGVLLSHGKYDQHKELIRSKILEGHQYKILRFPVSRKLFNNDLNRVKQDLKAFCIRLDNIISSKLLSLRNISMNQLLNQIKDLDITKEFIELIGEGLETDTYSIGHRDVGRYCNLPSSQNYINLLRIIESLTREDRIVDGIDYIKINALSKDSKNSVSKYHSIIELSYKYQYDDIKDFINYQLIEFKTNEVRANTICYFFNLQGFIKLCMYAPRDWDNCRHVVYKVITVYRKVIEFLHKGVIDRDILVGETMNLVDSNLALASENKLYKNEILSLKEETDIISSKLSNISISSTDEYKDAYMQLRYKEYLIDPDYKSNNKYICMYIEFIESLNDLNQQSSELIDIIQTIKQLLSKHQPSELELLTIDEMNHLIDEDKHTRFLNRLKSRNIDINNIPLPLVSLVDKLKSESKLTDEEKQLNYILLAGYKYDTIPKLLESKNYYKNLYLQSMLDKDRSIEVFYNMSKDEICNSLYSLTKTPNITSHIYAILLQLNKVDTDDEVEIDATTLIINNIVLVSRGIVRKTNLIKLL